MSALIWNKPEDKTYESGLDRGVFFTEANVGYAWNGLISVDQNVSGGEVSQYYFDGRKYLDFVYSEDFQASLSAFSTPKLFAECEGIRELAPGMYVPHQRRKTFGLSYRTGVGNEIEGDDYGYKIHLVWKATASPSGKSYQTRSDSVEIGNQSWTIDTVPPDSTLFKPTAHLEFSTLTAPAAKIQTLEGWIYGTSNSNPRLPTQAEVIALFQAA